MSCISPVPTVQGVSQQGGGCLTTLLHLRWIGEKKPVVSLEKHWIGGASHRSVSDSIAVVNVHFPPLHAPQRQKRSYIPLSRIFPKLAV